MLLFLVAYVGFPLVGEVEQLREGETLFYIHLKHVLNKVLDGLLDVVRKLNWPVDAVHLAVP